MCATSKPYFGFFPISEKDFMGEYAIILSHKFLKINTRLEKGRQNYFNAIIFIHHPDLYNTQKRFFYEGYLRISSMIGCGMMSVVGDSYAYTKVKDKKVSPPPIALVFVFTNPPTSVQ